MSMRFPRVGEVTVIVVCFILFSAILAPSADAASGVPFAGGSDVIAFGADNSAEIVVSSDMIALDMRDIGQDLYWDSSPHDVDGLLIRTTGYHGNMDCFFHLYDTWSSFNVTFTGIEGTEKEPGLQVMDEYLVSWNIPFNEDLLEGGIKVSRTPGSKSIWADVVRLEEGQYLEVYGLLDNLTIDGPRLMGVIYDSGKTFEIDNFIEDLAEPKDLCIALRNRGTEIMELEKEADEIICGTFNETSGHLVSLDVTDRDVIDPGFSAFICLGSVADLNGNASIGLGNGENISFTWDVEEPSFENPEETSTDSSGNNSGGCLVSGLSFNSFVLLIPLLLLIVRFRRK